MDRVQNVGGYARTKVCASPTPPPPSRPCVLKAPVRSFPLSVSLHVFVFGWAGVRPHLGLLIYLPLVRSLPLMDRTILLASIRYPVTHSVSLIRLPSLFSNQFFVPSFLLVDSFQLFIPSSPPPRMDCRALQIFSLCILFLAGPQTLHAEDAKPVDGGGVSAATAVQGYPDGRRQYGRGGRGCGKLGRHVWCGRQGWWRWRCGEQHSQFFITGYVST